MLCIQRWFHRGGSDWSGVEDERTGREDEGAMCKVQEQVQQQEVHVWLHVASDFFG